MLKQLGATGEFWLIASIAFLYPIFGSLLAAFSDVPNSAIDHAGLIALIVYECVVMLILWRIMRIREWTFADLSVAARVSDVFVGLALAAAFHVGALALWSAGRGLGVDAASLNDLVAIKRGLGLPTVVAISVLNPLYEEIFVCGYVVTVLGKLRSPWFAINASVAIRLTYHLYQGADGVLTILPMALLSACWYARTRRLWPLVIAHGLLDFIAFYRFA